MPPWTPPPKPRPKGPKQLGLFDKPARVRNYEKERAQRDAKHMAAGFKSYNDYEYQRRARQAVEVEGYASLGEKRAQQQKVKRFTQRFIDRVTEVGFNFEEWLEDEDFDEGLYWELFRDSYGKGTPA